MRLGSGIALASGYRVAVRQALSRSSSTSGSDAGFSLVEMVVVLLIVAVGSMLAVPMIGNLLSAERIGGNAQALSNSTAMTKMRAAARFGAARIRIDLAARTYRAEIWRKTGTPGWETEGPVEQLSPGVSFGFQSIAAAPPNTQGTIGQAAACRDDAGANIAGTACVVFNSRGLPIDSTGGPTGAGAFYITDNAEVFAVTVSATGLVRTWRARPTGTLNWVLQ